MDFDGEETMFVTKRGGLVKRRKVSAYRKFPKGCGRNAEGALVEHESAHRFAQELHLSTLAEMSFDGNEMLNVTKLGNSGGVCTTEMPLRKQNLKRASGEGSLMMYKKRVSPYGQFPRGFGQYALLNDKIQREDSVRGGCLVNKLHITANQIFVKGCGEIAALDNDTQCENSCAAGSVHGLDVKEEVEFVEEPDYFKLIENSTNSESVESCEERAVLDNCTQRKHGVAVGSINASNAKEEGEFLGEPVSSKQVGVLVNMKLVEGCGEYGPPVTAELSKDGVNDGSANESNVKEKGKLEQFEISVNRNFLEGCGESGPQVSTNLGDDGVNGSSPNVSKVKVKGVLVEPISDRESAEDCGQYASHFDSKLSEEGVTGGSVKEVKVKAQGALMDLGFVKQSGTSYLSETLEALTSSAPVESPNLLNDFLSETVNSPTSDMSLNLKEAEILDSLRDANEPDSKVFTNSVSQPEGLSGSVLPDLVQVNDPVHAKYPRRSITACRTFPAGCGRKALLEIMNKCRNPVVYSIDRRSDDEKSSGEKGLEQVVKANATQRRDEDEDGDALKRKLKGKTILESRVFKKDDSHLVKRSRNRDLSSIAVGLHTLDDQEDDIQVSVARNKVRKSLRLFQILCRMLMRDEEGKSKEGTGRKRPDLTSAKILRENNKWVNYGQQILGIVPGVEVGDEFHYRVELAIIGLHRPYQGGIDYVSRCGKILATSIVASGAYDDEMESSDVLVYSGQGGNPLRGAKIATDQKLVRGNLALKNSMDEKTPVRVIRGFKEVKGQDLLDARLNMAATLTYDGLYLVDKYWNKKGIYGNNVFMFQLRRISGQPVLAIRELKKSEKESVREGICVKDISRGKEKIPIGAVNRIDNEKPPQFEYITKMIYPLRYSSIPSQGCQCNDGCLNPLKCPCATKNGGRNPFSYDGAIVESKPLIYECGPKCKCPPSCYNRVSQHGIKFPLEVFMTKSRGWGVRALTSIPSGSFICEYTGELLQKKDADQRIGNDEYLFNVGRKYNDHALWEGLSKLIPSDIKSSSTCEAVEDVGFTIDATRYGNVGRFINHSSSPNLYAQNVLYDHNDKRMPRIMLFAAENIPLLKELTLQYCTGSTS